MNTNIRQRDELIQTIMFHDMNNFLLVLNFPVLVNHYIQFVGFSVNDFYEEFISNRWFLYLAETLYLFLIRKANN